LSRECIKNNIIKISAIWRININQFLEIVWQILQNEKLKWDFDLIDKIKVEKEEKKSYIKDITDNKIRKLVEQWYIDETEAKYVKVWEVYDPYLSYLTFVLPWWNDEAELWFWEELNKKWIMKWLEKHGVRKWDILKVKSIYDGYDDRYIQV
jgi:hypothetical protein